MIEDTYKLYIKFNDTDGFINYDAQFNNFTRTEKLHSGLKPADNSVSITIAHNTTLENSLRGIGDAGVEAYITKNGTRIFTGFVRRNFTFKNNGRMTDTAIELVSPSFILKRKMTENFRLLDCPVCTDSTSAVWQLFIAAGYDESSLSLLPTISTQLPYISIEADEQTYHDVITTLLYEYGYILDFNANGLPICYEIMPSSQSTSNTFSTGNTGNVYGTLNQSVKAETYEKFAITWTSTKTIEDTNIFSDTTNATTADKCEIEIEPQSYYGESDADSEGLYLEYSVEDADLLYAYDVELVCKHHSDIVQQEFTDYGTKAFLKLYNQSTAYNRMITQLDVNGTAICVDSTNIAKINNSDGDFAQLLEYTASYIYSQYAADTFTNMLANYYKYADFTYQLKSYDDFALGSFVNVIDPETGSVLCRVIQKNTNEMTGLITYQLEGYGEYSAATVSTESNKKKSNSGNTVALIQASYSKAISAIDVANKYALDLSPEYQVLSVNSSGTPYSSDDLTITAQLYYENTELSGVTYEATVNDESGIGTMTDNVFTLPVSEITSDNTVVKITATYTDASSNTITRSAVSTIAKLYAESSWEQYDMTLTDNAVKVDVDGVITPATITAEKIKRTADGQSTTTYGHITATIDDETEYPIAEYNKDSGSGYDEEYTYNRRMTPFILTIGDGAYMLSHNSDGLLFFYRHN